MIVREVHKEDPVEGETPFHLHAYLRLDRKINTSDPTCFDLGEYHGNYQGARSKHAIMQYIQKDPEAAIVTNLPALDSRSTNSKGNWKKARALAADGKVDEAIELLAEEERSARDLVLWGPKIRENLDSMTMSLHPIVTHPLEDFRVPQTLMEEITTHTIVIMGKTGVGKTTMAKALLPTALMTRHLDMIRKYRASSYHGIILDDMAFNHLHDEAQIALVDRTDNTQVHVRYGVAHIPAGTPVIITTNKRCDEILNLNNPAIQRRCRFYEFISRDEIFEIEY